MPDGRLYLYGSCDISGKKEYCGNEYRVFSTDDPQLSRWTDHGVSFRNTQDEPGIPWRPGVPLYAPDAAARNGKYYLYACGQDAFEGVAVSDRPYGRFPRRSRLPAPTETASILRFLSMTTGRRIIYGDSFL